MENSTHSLSESSPCNLLLSLYFSLISLLEHYFPFQGNSQRDRINKFATFSSSFASPFIGRSLTLTFFYYTKTRRILFSFLSFLLTELNFLSHDIWKKDADLGEGEKIISEIAEYFIYTFSWLPSPLLSLVSRSLFFIFRIKKTDFKLSDFCLQLLRVAITNKLVGFPDISSRPNELLIHFTRLVK